MEIKGKKWAKETYREFTKEMAMQTSVKGSSTSSIIREMQTMMMYYFTETGKDES